MDYLHGFTVTILVVTFLCYICETLAPEGNFGKYTALVTGLVVSLSIVHAFLQIRTFELESLDFPRVQARVASENTHEAVVEAQFAADLAAAVQESVEKEFGESVCVHAQVHCADAVLTVDGLTIENTVIAEPALTAFIRERFGLEPSYTRGGA